MSVYIFILHFEHRMPDAKKSAAIEITNQTHGLLLCIICISICVDRFIGQQIE